MRKLLFVPADPLMGRAWQASLQACRGPWEARIVCADGDASEQLADLEWDAVVAHLGSEKGAAVLTQARSLFPEAVRIGVVAQRQLRAPHPSFVHQVLGDPLDLQELEVALERSCRLRDMLRGERICQTLGEMGELPPAPGVYLQLMEKLNRPDASIGEIAEIIEGDVGTSARLLQLVNSVVFRTSHEILTVRTAAGFLGLDVIKNVVLSMEAFQAFEKTPSIPGFSLNDLQAHCRLTAAIAGQMQLPADVRNAAIVASLLHDIGKLVLAYKMPDRFARLVGRARAEQKPLHQIEEELWGITHAEVGAYLLGLWGLPLRVTEAIAYHHGPASVPHQRVDALAAVYVANLLAHETEGTTQDSIWDVPYLGTIGALSQVPGWKAMAREVSAAQEFAAARVH